MRAEKRVWIYAGLAVPEGRALVRPARRPSPAVTSVLVVGNDNLLLRSLLLPLSRLLDSVKAPLVTDLRARSNSTVWSRTPWLKNNLDRFRPSHVLVVLDPQRDMVARRVIDGTIERSGAKSVWLVKPGVFVSGGVAAPHRQNAVEIAAWAGRIWRAIQ